ncbi:MAG: tetratricopeptide repeat protein [Planctomycetes bacterium]|nr:tetratricopeptide repeat protein [Planctomycetota bacterium]MCW8136652.1 tetratricopeptide repeat protein [Planctomycetota bacterium]
MNPDDIRAAMQAGERAHARRLAKEATNAASPEEWMEIAAVLTEHGMIAPLVDLWRKRRDVLGLERIEQAPFATALNTHALEHMREGRADDALKLLDEALEQADMSYIRRNIASALLARGEFATALADIDSLLTIDPRDPEALLLLGIARYQSGDPELAVEPLEAAGDSADALLWLLKTLCLLQRDEARAVHARLLELHPDRAAAMLELEMAEPGSPLHWLT